MFTGFVWRTFRRYARALSAVTLIGILMGCNPSPGDLEPAEDGLIPLVLQTDWFAQPEHGGFYQALARGFYEEAGLRVTILEGGPNAMTTAQVLSGRAHFAMNRMDTVMTLVAQGLPLKMVMVTLQDDPQGILLHADDPAQNFADLDGRRVMAVPGLTWIRYVERRFGITMDILPHDFGMDRFLSDRRLIQQCLITNEPYYMERQGAPVRVLRLSDSGFNPFHGIYLHRDFARDHPDVVRRFVQASVRGWRDFVEGDPEPAFRLISERNRRMVPSFMAFSHRKLLDEQIVVGRGQSLENIGRIDPERIRHLHSDLRHLHLLPPELDISSTFSTQFLPDP
ncbi:MAG: ABC transporter substrate-binding protein [Opitutales bacterium]|nr:ABC transporter substrate-binding protein [Opitutales bacterium]